MDLNSKQEKDKSKNKIKAEKKKNAKKQKKEKHQNLMKELPPTAYSCSAHEDDYLRIITENNKTHPSCKSCGFKLEGKYGYLCCPKTTSCFQLCSTCRVCTKNHILRNVLTLSQFTGNELYSENKFTCHGCKQDKEVKPERGVLHCQPCLFSICMDCEQRTNALWDRAIKEENDL